MSTESTKTANGLGRAIAAFRAEQGVSRKELATKSEVSYPYLAAIEKGDRQPSSRILNMIAEALGTSAGDLHLRADSLTRPTDSQRGTTWVLQSGARYAPEQFMTAPPPLSAPPMDDSRLIDELRDEVMLLRKRMDRMDSEIRELRQELYRKGDF